MRVTTIGVTVRKWHLNRAGMLVPYDEVSGSGNVLTDVGANAFWQKLTIGGGTSGAWDGHFGNSSADPWRGAYIAVGNDDTAPSVGDVDLAAAGGSDAYYKEMDSGYPQFEDGSSISADETERRVVFKATFGTGVANFTWREWAIGTVGNGEEADGGGAGSAVTFNGTGGTFDNKILNRALEAFGTKTSSESWELSATVGFEV